MNKKVIISVVSVILLIVAYTQLGLYSVQPIGALPQGVTAIVHRIGDEPFFNSPDGMSLRRIGNVSLLTRMAALAAGPLKERTIIRLPYMEWAYIASTGGQKFDR